MGMRSFHRERDDGAFPLGHADNAQRIYRGQKLMCISAQRFLMGADGRSPNSLYVVERRSKPDRLHDGWGASLESMRWMVVGDCFLRDFLDHLAATLVRRQLLKKFALTVKHTDSGRRIDFVPGENVEVGIEVAHVHVKVHGALRTIDEHANPSPMRDFDDLLDRGGGP